MFHCKNCLPVRSRYAGRKDFLRAKINILAAKSHLPKHSPCCRGWVYFRLRMSPKHRSYLDCPVRVVRLVVRVVKLGHIRVLEGISSADALIGAKVQALRHQVQCLRRRPGKNLIQRYLSRGGDGFEHGPGKRRFDGLDVLG